MAIPAGTHAGPYIVLSPIGAGGMGEVYRARDPRLNRDVALKVLPAHLASSREALARFEREARAAAALSHPNIVAIYDVGQYQDGAYVVLHDGACAAYIERGGKHLLTFGDLDSATWAEAVVEANKGGRLPRLQIERIDDASARTSPHADALRAAGFADGYKGLTLRG